MKKIKLSINGLPHEFVVDEKTVLLDILREDLDLIGAKQSCDRKGQCGACTVLVDGKAVRSCLARMVKLEGAQVITVEGLGTPDNPHLIQEAFALSGAVQCGFCTPGMIMSAKALLDANPDPSAEEIKQAFSHNLCRCTGYAKIIEAVQLAGRFLRGVQSPADLRPPADAPLLGVNHMRPSALIKACGVARFAADYKIKDALELAVVRSPLPHAVIKSIDAQAALMMPGVAGVMMAGDVKGTNRLKLFVPDRPVLCEDRVRYIGDPIVAVAAATLQQAREAAQAIKVELEPLPALESPAQSLAEGAAQLHPDRPNLAYEQPLARGDANAALAQAAAVVKARFTTQTNHQAPLETEATVAYWEPEEDQDKLVIVGRSINIHTHLGMLQEALGWENMRYEEAFSGGQFGIKIDVISEGLAGAAAIHFRRPVRYVPSLAESMLMSSKRHAFDMEVTLAADAQGKITAYLNDFVVDNGAYHSMGHVVVNRALLMLCGAYYIPNLQIQARLVYTNNPWGSAARGAGPPQVNYALEAAVDMLARKMGLDPLEFRLNNFLAPGQALSTGQTVEQWPIDGLAEAIRPHYQRACAEAKAYPGDGKTRRGVGLGSGSFGIGSPGDASVVAVELDADGGVSIYGAAADPGEGNDSMLTQLAAQVMDIPLDKVRLFTRSTDLTAASGPAAGSRITYMMGGAMVDGLEQLKQAMAQAGAKTASELEAAGLPKRFLGRKKNLDAKPLDAQGQGPNFASQVHAMQMAEVEVDTETGQVKVIKMTTAVDAGTVINPLNLIGQLEGGMDMGVGFALREQYIAGQTHDWRSFKFPTMATSFDTEVIIRETPRTNGPLGATGVGEMCMVPTAPAVLNAIEDAVGVRILDLPATPEKVKAALAAAGR